jgi:UDP-N-acetylmuramyl pentapeptide phosphotransferase/UDP-N-acetylglucosamine-1-phosphate transferase
MFYQLVLYFQDFLRQAGLWPYANVFRYQTFRMAFAVVTSFFLLMAFAPAVIRILRRLKIGDAADFGVDAANQFYASRAGTPTMGGILILPAILISTAVWADIGNFYVILGMITVAWLGMLGGFDDFLKLVKKSRDGLRMWEKLIFQVGLAVLLAFFLYQMGGRVQLPEGGTGIALNLPFYKFPIALAFWSFALVAILVVAGTSNAVNLTDGMDGLAIGSMVPPTLVFLVICYVAGRIDYARYLFIPYVPGTGELAIFCGAGLHGRYGQPGPGRRHRIRGPGHAAGSAPLAGRRPVRYGGLQRDAAGGVLQVHQAYARRGAEVAEDVAAASPFSTGRMGRDADGRPVLAGGRDVRRPGPGYAETAVGTWRKKGCQPLHRSDPARRHSWPRRSGSIAV